MKVRVIDIETLKNFFSMVGYDITTKKIKRFVIHKSRNDFEELCEYLLESDGLIGFNILHFDYPVLHEFIHNVDNYVDKSGAQLASLFYKRSQKVIGWAEPGSQREWIEPSVRLCDPYRIWHLNNKSRATSLKWLQFCMGWSNMMEMPYSHDTLVTEAMIPEILAYNENDVMSTYEFYLRTRERIDLRKDLKAKYGRDMANYADTKIGETIFMMNLSEAMGVEEKELRKLRTPRYGIQAADCLIDDIQFVSKEFNSVLNYYKGLTITNTKNSNDDVISSCVFDGVTYDFGFGGLHALRAPGVYRKLLSADVRSYYPNLAISNNFYPEHLGLEFCQVYKQLYDERLQYPKGSPESEALKLALNGTYGASNAPWSPFYDPMFTMKITLNGQFILAILCERLTLLRAARIIMVNTDGLEMEVIDQAKVDKVCDLWQREFKLQLEFNTYNKIAIANVNNYIGVLENGKVKEKGAYETEKLLYKNQSMRIVPKAVRDYFINDIPIAKTINECEDLHQFVLGHRAKTGNLRYRRVDGHKLVDEKLPKNVRYYISHTGGSIVKVTKQTKKPKKSDPKISPNQISLFGVTAEQGPQEVDKLTNLHVGRRMTVFNKWEDKPFKQYGVDKSFYINEAQKMIDAVVNNQSSI